MRWRRASRSCARWSTSSRASRPPSPRCRASAHAPSAAPARAARRAAPKRRAATGAGKGRRGRPKGSGQRGKQALDLVKKRPGITIPEIADAMGIKQNYLYRVMPGLEKDGLVTKKGRGWHAKDAA